MNVLDWLNFVQALVRLVPTIIEIVKQIEAAFPKSGLGPQKLALVTESVKQATASTPETAALFAGKNIEGFVAGIVNSTVALMNANKQP